MSRARCAISPSEPVRVRWAGVAQFWTIAAGVIGGETGGEQALGDAVEVLDAHVYCQGVGGVGQRGPVDLFGIFVGGFVAGGDGGRDGQPAVCQRDTRVGAQCSGGGYARDDFKVDPRRAQGRSLFAAAPEDQRIATLEPHDILALPCVLDEQRVDIFLRCRWLRRGFADENLFGVFGGQCQNTLIDKAVVENYLGVRQALDGA